MTTYVLESLAMDDRQRQFAHYMRADFTANAGPHPSPRLRLKLWQHLRQPPFREHHFRRQATIGPYFADFASHRLGFIIEVDGGQHSYRRDLQRTTYLEAKGYRVLRFWNNDVLQNLAGVLSVVDSVIRQRPPTPDPSPPQAGGGE